jgi:hypothetical protein
MKAFAADEGLSCRPGPREEQRVSGHFVTRWFTYAENICTQIWLSLVSDLGTF